MNPSVQTRGWIAPGVCKRSKFRGKPGAASAGSYTAKPLDRAAEKQAVERPHFSDKLIASYASPQAFAPRTRAALAGLGYRLIAASTRGRFDDDSWHPSLRIVDDRHLDKLPEENYLPRTPVIVLRGARPGHWRDPRVVGEAARPAGLADLYPLIQRALEDNPRGAPRTATQIPARCTRADRRWMGAIVSLSVDGCLFQTRSDMSQGQEFNLLFPLPRGRMVSTRARVEHCYDNGVGMSFRSSPAAAREAIAEFVTERLATSRI